MLPVALADWATRTPVQFLWLLGSALTGTIGVYCMSWACEIGDASVVTPIDFAQFPTAAVLGFVAFAEFPSSTMVLGAAIIVLATFWIARFAGKRRAAG